MFLPVSDFSLPWPYQHEPQTCLLPCPPVCPSHPSRLAKARPPCDLRGRLADAASCTYTRIGSACSHQGGSEPPRAGAGLSLPGICPQDRATAHALRREEWRLGSGLAECTVSFHAPPGGSAEPWKLAPDELQVSSGTRGRKEGIRATVPWGPGARLLLLLPCVPSPNLTQLHQPPRVPCWSPLQSGGAGRKRLSEHRGGEGDTHLEVPISCDSQPVTGAAEMLRHGCDEADLASEARNFKGLGKEGTWVEMGH